MQRVWPFYLDGGFPFYESTIMHLTTEQRQRLLTEHGCYVTDVCDGCGQVLGAASVVSGAAANAAMVMRLTRRVRAGVAGLHSLDCGAERSFALTWDAANVAIAFLLSRIDDLGADAQKVLPVPARPANRLQNDFRSLFKISLLTAAVE